MESLALAVTIILLTMFATSAAALALAFVNRKWARITSTVFSVPAFLLALNLLNVESTGARVMGISVGVVVGLAWYRNIKFLRNA